MGPAAPLTLAMLAAVLLGGGGGPPPAAARSAKAPTAVHLTTDGFNEAGPSQIFFLGTRESRA